MKGIIDRFEGNMAVIETKDGNITIPRKIIPDAREGDVIAFTKNAAGVSHAVVLPEETKQRADKIDTLMKDLFLE